MALNPSGAISLGGPVAGQSIALELGLSPTAVISLNDTAVRALAGVPTGAIIMPTNFWGKSSYIQTQQACIAYGQTGSSYPSVTNISNIMSNTGVVSANITGVGTARLAAAASTYGGDKGLFAYGAFGNSYASYVQAVNLVSNTGVVSADTPAAGTARYNHTGSSYSSDKAFYAYGSTNAFAPSTVVTYYNVTNLVSNTGVIASDVPAAGNKNGPASLSYGKGKAIIAYGNTGAGAYALVSQLVSDTGVFSSTTPTAGVGRYGAAGLAIGSDTGIFVYGTVAPAGAYGFLTSSVSNTGVLSTSTNIPAPGANGRTTSGAKYGGDKAFTAYGFALPSAIRTLTLFSNTGVVTSQGTATTPSRSGATACGFSST